MGTSWSPITTTLVISTVEGIVLYLLFVILRPKQSLTHIFFSRRNVEPPPQPRIPLASDRGPWWWFNTAREIDDNELPKGIGMDAYVFLRMLRICFNITAISSFFAIVVLIPIYTTANNTKVKGTDGFNDITIANVSDNGSRLWATFIVHCITVGLAIYFITEEWKNLLPKRIDYLIHNTPLYSRATAFVEGIPPQSQSDEVLYRMFSAAFPNQIISARVFINTPTLDKYLKKAKNFIVEEENAVAYNVAHPNKRKTIREGAKCKCIGGKKVDACSHYDVELERLTNLALVEHNAIEAMNVDKEKGNSPRSMSSTSEDMSPRSPRRWSQSPADCSPSSIGVVVFSSIQTKENAVREGSRILPSSIHLCHAPLPNDVIWGNACVSRVKQQSSKSTVNCFWSLGVLFWVIPIAFVQAVSNLNTIQDTIPIWVPSNPVVYGILAGYLPVIALLLLMMILPIAISNSAEKVIRLRSRHQVELYTLRWHFAYQVANLWLIIIGGSLFNQLDQFVNHPGNTIKLIAAAVPGAAQFFILILITQTFTGLFMELSRIVPIAVSWIMKKIKKEAGKSQRDIDAELKPPFLKWGWAIPPFILNIFVGFTYVSLVPIVQPFAAVHFGLAYLVYKYQLVHVYRQEVEGGGRIWLLLSNMLFGCLYMAQIIIIFYLSIKKGKIQAPLSVIPLALTFLAHIHILRTYARPYRTISDDVARTMDSEVGAMKTAELRRASGIYMQPSLDTHTWEIVPQPYRKIAGMRSDGSIVL